MTDLTPDQYNVLSDRLDKILSVVNTIDSDISKDREDMHNFVIRLGSLENKIEEVWQIVHNIPDKLQTKVQSAVEPVRKEALSLRKIIETKTFIKMSVKNVKKSLWKFPLIKLHLLKS